MSRRLGWYISWEKQKKACGVERYGQVTLADDNRRVRVQGRQKTEWGTVGSVLNRYVKQKGGVKIKRAELFGDLDIWESECALGNTPTKPNCTRASNSNAVGG